MLLLVPSRLELEKLVPEAAGADRPWVWPGRSDVGGERVVVARCGVGLAWPGTSTVAMIGATKLREVVLAGLAGTYDEDLALVGSLVMGTSVSLHGLGVGEGRAHRRLGDCGGVLAEEAGDAERERPLSSLDGLAAVRAPLLTVAAASATAGEAGERRARYPGCVAEDMESWSVARAAEHVGASCTVLRGISNRAGDRDPGAWRVDRAIAVLREAIDSLTGAAR